MTIHSVTSTSRANGRELRNAFGSYPTGVTVVTCHAQDGSSIGVTVNSFVPLSLHPPLLSIALHQGARHLSAFIGSRGFAVNVLNCNQQSLSRLFSSPSECSWADVRFHVAPSGHLLLDGAIAYFLCRQSGSHPVGDHTLLIGEIEEYLYDATREPLAFLGGRYGMFRPSAHSPPLDPADSWPFLSAVGWG